MTIIRATVYDDGDELHFVVGEEVRDPYGVYSGPTKQYVPKMWANVTGLHVQSTEDESIWTVYPWPTVFWYEERR